MAVAVKTTNGTNLPSSVASVDNDPALDGQAASVEVIPSDLASQVATRHQAVLLTGGYVLYAVPLSEDKTPMVQDIYEVERHGFSSSVPVIGDFVPSSLINRPPEAAIPLPDLHGLGQTPLAFGWVNTADRLIRGTSRYYLERKVIPKLLKVVKPALPEVNDIEYARDML